MPLNERSRWLLLLVLPPLFWAGNALVARASVGAIPPLAFSFWRWLLALSLLLPFTARSLWRSRAELAANWAPLLGMGLCSVTAYNSLLYMAVQTTTAINATLMGSSLPLMVLIIARLWLGEPIRLRQAAGIAVSGLGLAAVITRGEPARLLQVELAPGDGLMLLATLSWAIYSVMLRRYPMPLRGYSLLSALMIIGVAGIFPLYLWEAAHVQGGLSLTLHTGAFIVYTAVLASLAAYYFWNGGVAAVGAATAGQYTYLIPLFTALLAAPALGESFQWFHGLGGALIFAGIALASLRRGR